MLSATIHSSRATCLPALPAPKLIEVPSDATPDPDTTAEQFIGRAELLADLGRYDEAIAEIGFALALEPANRTARTLLARLHLAAGRPAEALAATDPLATSAPKADLTDPSGVQAPPEDRTAVDIAILHARAMALIDLRRFAEAAELAETILRLGPENPDALTTGAAVLSQSRGGQAALNAAWRAVELAPDRADTHLVLGLVAARLAQFQLAERAYRKALELDPALGDVHHDIGIMQLEQRRYSEALASLAEAAAASGSGGSLPGAGSPVTRGVRALLRFGAGYAIIAPVLVACAGSGNSALGRIQAIAMAVIGLGLLGFMATRLPGRPLPVLRPLMSEDRWLAVAVWAVVAGPLLVLLYALVGSPWPLAVAVAAGFVTLFVVELAPNR